MKPTVRLQLWLMMFLQFVIWGAWYGQLSKYLFAIHFDGDQVGRIYSTFSVAMIISPFFVGMLADRYFSAEKVLGVLNLLGAALLFLMTQTTSYDSFFWISFAYFLTFAPTIAITSSISMRQMSAPEKEFPAIRMWGTVAWIAVTNLIGYMGWGDKATIFHVAMITSVVIGLYAFTLPKTPPWITGPVSMGQVLGREAFVLFRSRAYLIFFIASILICIPLAFYYAMGNPSITDAYKSAFMAAHPGQPLPDTFFVENKMSLGQFSEVFFMLLIPLAYRRLGIRWILVVALIAWIIRFLCFGYGNAGGGEWMLYLGIVLHGICFDFFFVSGMIYTDQQAGDRIKSQAQGLISLATYGVGMFFGSLIAGSVQKMYTSQAGGQSLTDWTKVWMVPAGIALAVLVLFLLLFKDKKATSGS